MSRFKLNYLVISFLQLGFFRIRKEQKWANRKGQKRAAFNSLLSNIILFLWD